MNQIIDFITGGWKKDLDMVCPECGEIREDDARVESGMKCGFCAYGFGDEPPVEEL